MTDDMGRDKRKRNLDYPLGLSAIALAAAVDLLTTDYPTKVAIDLISPVTWGGSLVLEARFEDGSRLYIGATVSGNTCSGSGRAHDAEGKRDTTAVHLIGTTFRLNHQLSTIYQGDVMNRDNEAISVRTWIEKYADGEIDGQRLLHELTRPRTPSHQPVKTAQQEPLRLRVEDIARRLRGLTRS